MTLEAVSVRDGEGMKPTIATGERDGLVEKTEKKNTSKREGICCLEWGRVRLHADLE